MYKILLIFSAIVVFSSCTNKTIDDLELNPYDTQSGVDLMIIDSTQKFYGFLPHVKAFFHVNDAVAYDTARTDRVIVYRDGVEYARLSPTNVTFFVDITTQPGATYNYQMAFLMIDNTITKKTTPYIINF